MFGSNPLNTSATGPLIGTTLDYQSYTVRSPDGTQTSVISQENGGILSIVFAQNRFRFKNNLGVEKFEWNNAFFFYQPVYHPSYTVAGLPSAASIGAGGRAFVTDSLLSLTAGLGTTVAGLGANFVPVYIDPTNAWKIG